MPARLSSGFSDLTYLRAQVEIAGGSVGGKALMLREPVRRDRIVTILPSGKVRPTPILRVPYSFPHVGRKRISDGRVRSCSSSPARPHVGRAGPWAPRPSGSERSSSRPSCSSCTVTPTSSSYDHARAFETPPRATWRGSAAILGVACCVGGLTYHGAVNTPLDTPRRHA